MADPTLIEMLNSLAPQEQDSVRDCVTFLKQSTPKESAFVRAAQQFIEEHPTWPARLAQ